jgi:hypothetical protein
MQDALSLCVGVDEFSLPMKWFANAHRFPELWRTFMLAMLIRCLLVCSMQFLLTDARLGILLRFSNVLLYKAYVRTLRRVEIASFHHDCGRIGSLAMQFTATVPARFPRPPDHVPKNFA